jgi:hypothetical protein
MPTIIKPFLFLVYSNAPSKVLISFQDLNEIVRPMLRKGLLGILSFSIGGSILMFVLRFVTSVVYVEQLIDWMNFLLWVIILSLVGFILLGFGSYLMIRSAIKEAKQND